MYEEVQEGAKLVRLLGDYLDDYNSSATKTMNLGGCWI